MKNTFELEHVGINTDNAGEAEQLALLLCKLFNLEPRHGQKSEFAGNYFECMKSPFLGKNGHIAMRTPDLKAADEGKLEEVFGTGTAAVVSPVKELDWEGKVAHISGGHIGELTQKLYDTLTGIQWGKLPDTKGWIVPVE